MMDFKIGPGAARRTSPAVAYVALRHGALFTVRIEPPVVATVGSEELNGGGMARSRSESTIPRN